MPLTAYISEVMAMLDEGNHPRGELLLERDRPRRWAERDFGREHAAEIARRFGFPLDPQIETLLPKPAF